MCASNIIYTYVSSIGMCRAGDTMVVQGYPWFVYIFLDVHKAYVWTCVCIYSCIHIFLYGSVSLNSLFKQVHNSPEAGSG